MTEKSVAKSDVDYLDVFRKGQSKWTGIQTLLDYLGISDRQCVAFGDNENDLEMIANAGLGIAMENGVDMVKAVAGHITLSHEEAGVAYGIRTWVAGNVYSGALKAFTKGFSVLGLIMTGAMTAQYVSFKTTCVADFGGIAFRLQNVLDQIMPGLLPLGITRATFFYLRKKNNPARVLLVMFALSVVLTVLKICG